MVFLRNLKNKILIMYFSSRPYLLGGDFRVASVLLKNLFFFKAAFTHILNYLQIIIYLYIMLQNDFDENRRSDSLLNHFSEI